MFYKINVTIKYYFSLFYLKISNLIQDLVCCFFVIYLPFWVRIVSTPLVFLRTQKNHKALHITGLYFSSFEVLRQLYSMWGIIFWSTCNIFTADLDVHPNSPRSRSQLTCMQRLSANNDVNLESELFLVRDTNIFYKITNATKVWNMMIFMCVYVSLAGSFVEFGGKVRWHW